MGIRLSKAQEMPNSNTMLMQTKKAPFSLRCLSLFSLFSPIAIHFPNHTIGCGNLDGSPKIRSRSQPSMRERVAISITAPNPDPFPARGKGVVTLECCGERAICLSKIVCFCLLFRFHILSTPFPRAGEGMGVGAVFSTFIKRSSSSPV